MLRLGGGGGTEVSDRHLGKMQAHYLRPLQTAGSLGAWRGAAPRRALGPRRGEGDALGSVNNWLKHAVSAKGLKGLGFLAVFLAGSGESYDHPGSGLGDIWWGRVTGRVQKGSIEGECRGHTAWEEGGLSVSHGGRGSTLAPLASGGGLLLGVKAQAPAVQVLPPECHALE